MKFIIDNKVYDTEKSEKIYELNFLSNSVKVFMTKKRNFFKVLQTGTAPPKAISILEDEVKRFLKADYDTYLKIFGELEEG